MTKYLKHFKETLIILTLLGGLFGTYSIAINYFAKRDTVEKLDRRIGLSISQDIIHSKEADIRWMEQQTIFERKEAPRSAAETEIIKSAQKDLVQSKERQEDRVQKYEEDYGEKAEL